MHAYIIVHLFQCFHPSLEDTIYLYVYVWVHARASSVTHMFLQLSGDCGIFEMFGLPRFRNDVSIGGNAREIWLNKFVKYLKLAYKLIAFC